MKLNKLLELKKDKLFLHLKEDIDSSYSFTLLEAISGAKKGQEVIIAMDSPGGNCGSIDQIIQLINVLKKKVKLSIINVGTIASSAIDVFMSVDNRYALDGAHFLLHRPKTSTGDKGLSLEELEEYRKDLAYWEARTVKDLKKYNIKLTKKQIEDFTKGLDVIIYSKKAKKAGLITAELK